MARRIGRWLLATFLVAAGVAHLAMPDEFLAQVPAWMPARLTVVYASGIVEIVLGVALVAAPRHRAAIGWAVAALLIAVFPGNVNQAITGDDAFGLTSPEARWGRLLLQPLFVVWALWSTNAWQVWRQRTTSGRYPGHSRSRSW